MEELISIIIPVYNVEEYISRCINSLLKQSYKNLQFIFVDDGTKDNCVDIIKGFQEKDSRIELYRKKNGGLSSARNYGMRYIRGEFVCFIDSDDWIEDDYIETLYEIIKSSGAEIACGGFDYVYDDKIKPYPYKMKNTDLKRYDALLALSKGKWMTNHVWNKMYSVCLFENISFEEGRHFEDIYIMHQLFDRANSVSCIDKTIYHYYMRATSIMHEENPQNVADIFIGHLSRYNFLKQKELKRNALKYCAWSCFEILFLVDHSRIKEDDYRVAIEFWDYHKEILKLGIKYWFMYRFPELYAARIK